MEARATVTVEEAAHMLGIGRNTAYEAAKRGEFPGAIRIGKRIVVSRNVLDRLLSSAQS